MARRNLRKNLWPFLSNQVHEEKPVCYYLRPANKYDNNQFVFQNQKK
jgi:hypothetical protein